MSVEDARARLRAYLVANGSGSKADEILSAARVAVRLQPEPGAGEVGIPVDASKLGGDPDAPEDFVWPTRRKAVRKRRSFLPWGKKEPEGPSEVDVPLVFITQIVPARTEECVGPAAADDLGQGGAAR